MSRRKPSLRRHAPARCSERAHPLTRPTSTALTLGSNPGFSLLDALTGHAVSLGSILATIDVSNMFWAFSQLSYKPHPSVLEQLWTTAIDNVSQSDGRAVSMLLESTLRNRHKPPQDTLALLTAHVLRTLDEYSAREISNIAISVVRLGHKPPPGFHAALDSKIVAMLGAFSDRDLSLCFTAFRLQGFTPSQETLDAVRGRFEATSRKMKEKDLVQLLYSLASMHAQLSKPTLDALCRRLTDQKASFTSDGLVRVCDAFVMCGYDPGEELLKQAAKKKRVSKRKPQRER